jgi:hypothetical protein
VDFSEHLAISAAGSAAILLGTGDLPSAAAFSAMGVFMDLDHFVDYWRETGFNLDIPRFMSYFWSRSVRRMWLPLHAWEWLALVAGWLLIWKGHPAWLAWGLAGWAVHLMLDHRFNQLHGLAYFFFFRLRHGFDADILNND